MGKLNKALEEFNQSIKLSPTNVDAYFESQWVPLQNECSTLPVALDMAGLYEQMLRRLMPNPARPGELLQDHVERLTRVRTKQSEYTNLEARMLREKQFNRKVELNTKLRSLNKDIETLTS